MALNEKYSYKDFTGKYFTDIPASEFNNSEIVGSCFASQVPNREVFPSGITGVHFEGCNLDNVIVPPGNTETGGCHRRTAWQNDGENWNVDETLKPVTPRSIKAFERLGLSSDPTDIPADFIRKEIHDKTEWLATKDTTDVTEWFLETAQITEQVVKHVKKHIPLVEWNKSIDKTLWSKGFDAPPSETLSQMPNGVDSMLLEGNVTLYTIEGKGLYFIDGKKPRRYENVPVTEAAEIASRDADVEALRALNPALAGRLGY